MKDIHTGQDKATSVCIYMMLCVCLGGMEVILYAEITLI